MPHTATAEHILSRMTEIQKIRINSATPGQLEYIRQTTGGYGPITEEVMEEIHAQVLLKYSTWDSTLTMVPSTWKW